MFTDHAGLTVDGDVTVQTTQDQHANVNGTVHGGLLATMLDSAMGEASRADLEEGQSTATVSMTVTYLRPGKIGDRLVARGELRQAGESLRIVEGEVTGEDGKPVAHGIATYTVLDKD